MENEVINAYTESVRSEIFKAIDVDFDSVTDLEGFENFVYGYGERVIRVTHDSHRTEHQLLGELEFLRFLHEGGGAVATPIPFSGQDVVSIGDFHICQFERATGRGASMEEAFSAATIRQWGRCIGVFHRLATAFKPVYKRQDWVADENHQFDARIPADQEKVLGRCAELMERLAGLEQPEGAYGLIHSDAHAGNYVNDSGSLTFFDFDDCLYTWFGYDIATILLGVAIQPWVEDSQDAMEEAVSKFLPVFMQGYSEENEPGCLMWAHMHEFLRLRELSLYGVVHAHMNPDDPGGWFSHKFMRDRRTRIEQGLPYVDLDFSGYN